MKPTVNIKAIPLLLTHAFTHFLRGNDVEAALIFDVVWSSKWVWVGDD